MWLKVYRVFLLLLKYIIIINNIYTCVKISKHTVYLFRSTVLYLLTSIYFPYTHE